MAAQDPARREGDIPPEDAELIAPIVGWLCRRYRERPYADLLTLAWLGLVDARARWAPERGEWRRWARTHVKYFVLDRVRAEHPLPRGLLAHLRAIDRAEDRLRARLFRRPTASELAAELGIDRERLFRWQLLSGADYPRDIEHANAAEPENADADAALVELQAAVATPPADVLGRIAAAEALATLPERPRELVRRTVLEGETLTRAAAALGIASLAHACRLRGSALRDLAPLLQ